MRWTKVIAFAVMVVALSVPHALAQDSAETNCLVYFTATFCHNCEITDPIVLQQWTSQHEDLVVIEYMFESWGDPNAAILGSYAQQYNQISAVPRMFISEDQIVGGRMEIPEVDIGSLRGNKCMIDGGQRFEDIDLNSIPGEPLKIWSGNRLLIREKGSEVSSDFLRQLLSAEDLQQAIDTSEHNIQSVIPEPVPIAYNEVDFDNGIMIEDSWLLYYNDIVTINSSNPNGSNPGGNQTDYIELPFFGRVDLAETSLPLLTVLIGLADGFNPCAFFILTFLLAAMIYARSRKRILIVGSVFVFFSAFIYFLFMSAWLNVFLIGSEIVLLTIFAGLVATAAGLINMKDYFFFKKGVSLTLPTKDKIKFTKRVENMLTKAETLPALIAGTVLIAVTVNLYELLCTVGFPLVYTRILTMQNLPGIQYYMYLAFYNIMYVIPLAVIVVLFAATLGAKRFTVEGVKKLKLVSGMIIFLFGINLLMNPSLLQNVSMMFTIILLSLFVSAVIISARSLAGRKSKAQQS